VQSLSEYWCACTQLRSQLRLVSVKYPISIALLPSGGFKATAKIMLSKKKAKALISFIFNEETFALWPSSIGDVKIDAEVVYGTVK
jgi:kinetochore protein Spc7/SPC105